MKKQEFNKEYTFKVQARFGSKFQEDTAIEALWELMTGWCHFYNDTHKKNDIRILRGEYAEDIKIEIAEAHQIFHDITGQEISLSVDKALKEIIKRS